MKKNYIIYGAYGILGVAYLIATFFFHNIAYFSEPSKSILTSIFNFGSLTWIPLDPLLLLKITFFIVFLVILYDLRKHIRINNTLMLVISIILALCLAIYFPYISPNNEYAVVLIFTGINCISGFFLTILYKTVTKIRQTMYKKILLSAWWVIAFILVTQALNYSGINYLMPAESIYRTFSTAIVMGWMILIFPIGFVVSIFHQIFHRK